MKFRNLRHGMGFIKILYILLLFLIIAADITYASTIKDETIAQAITNLLRRDRMGTGERVDVFATQGIVTMTGRVDNPLMRRRAAQLALTVRGVRSVINRIEIFPLGRMDDAIKKDILMAVRNTSSPGQDDFQINVRNGYVFMSGKVNSQDAKVFCIKLAFGINGVKKIISHIELKDQHELTDDDIKANIKRRLLWNVWVDDNRIDIQVIEGRVNLRGRVGSLAEKMAALHEALMADGTVYVENKNLIIDRTLHNKMRRHTTYSDKTDVAIKKALKDTFSLDPRLTTLKAEISVASGIVTLNGCTNNLCCKRFVEQDAKNTVGVRIVKNNLKICTYNIIQ
jgi:osmotically-inducible protein OsmY